MKTTVIIRQVFRNIKNQIMLVENLFSDIEIEVNKEYVIELREVRSKRTLQQNKYMWALIHKIASHESQNMNEVDIYSLALEQANAKYIYVKALAEAEDILRKSFRAVRVVRPDYENEKEFVIYKCFVGSSKLNTKEMGRLLDIIIAWANELGIETDEKYYTN